MAGSVPARLHGALALGLAVRAPAVAAALDAGRPVVALESTVISHGLPFPENLAAARALEEAVAAHGATPATVAILRGRARIGLAQDDLAALAEAGRAALKCSRRDLAFACATGAVGATTVAGTMALAARAGIRVFATGGIGGVHRGGENTLDVSADLRELGRTRVAVVCAGAKSVLDIGRTLEYLETEGIPVLGFGTDDFPAFFTPSSGFRCSARVDSAREAARVIAAGGDLGLENGTVIAVPIAAEDAADCSAIEDATQTALHEAGEKGIVGRDITPYLLARVNELTGGASLRANLALLKRNAAVAADIAVELAKLQDVDSGGKRCS